MRSFFNAVLKVSWMLLGQTAFKAAKIGTCLEKRSDVQTPQRASEGRIWWVFGYVFEDAGQMWPKMAASCLSVPSGLVTKQERGWTGASLQTPYTAVTHLLRFPHTHTHTHGGSVKRWPCALCWSCVIHPRSFISCPSWQKLLLDQTALVV